jgi:peptidoglycan/LPS O-acetylase OafA/YrhL
VGGLGTCWGVPKSRHLRLMPRMECSYASLTTTRLKTDTLFYPSQLLNPFFLSSWIGSPLHYWNSVGWSISTQVGFYFMFPRIARAVKKKLYLEEGGLVVSVRHTAHTKEGESNDKTKNKKGEKQIVTTGALQETDDALIDLRYTRRFRMLYFLSIVIPFAAMAFFNNPAFREYWSGPDVQVRDSQSPRSAVRDCPY